MLVAAPERKAGGGRESLPKEERYGWWSFSPDCLQCLSSPKWAVGFFCLASLLQGAIINGLLHYFLPTIEKRFRLSSTESGCMSTAYDIGAMLAVIPLTYLGGRPSSHRPRALGLGLLVMGFGCLIFSLPAFVAKPPHLSSRSRLCQPDLQGPLDQDSTEDYTPYFWLMFIGNLLNGVGACPLYTVAITYIDQNVPPDHSSIYLGVYYTMAVVGPFLGMVTGGLLSQVNADFLFPSKQLQRGDVQPSDHAWIGCWWLGFTSSGILCWLAAIPILGLPKQLPGSEDGQGERRSLRRSSDKGLLGFKRLKELPKAAFNVIKRVRFILITLAACCEAIIFSGMSAFLAKLLGLQFQLSLTQTAIYMTVISIPSTLVGIGIGSLMIKLLKMSVREMMGLNVTVSSLSLPCVFAVFIYCPHMLRAGITVPYYVPSQLQVRKISNVTLLAGCNKDCHCDPRNFQPVCGIDGVEYFSACFAGCKESERQEGLLVYRRCSCIEKEDKGDDDVEAYGRPCQTTCELFPLFVILLFLYLVFTFAALVPTVTVTLRAVPVELGSLALGLQWLVGRALGTIPGPVLLGRVIDEACTYWLTVEGKEGNCLLYNHQHLARNTGLVLVTFKAAEVGLFAACLLLAIYRPDLQSQEEVT